HHAERDIDGKPSFHRDLLSSGWKGALCAPTGSESGADAAGKGFSIGEEESHRWVELAFYYRQKAGGAEESFTHCATGPLPRPPQIGAGIGGGSISCQGRFHRVQLPLQRRAETF